LQVKLFAKNGEYVIIKAHENLLSDRFKIKGAEAADACAKNLKNLELSKRAVRVA
jgi:hypothetical protein